MSKTPHKKASGLDLSSPLSPLNRIRSSLGSRKSSNSSNPASFRSNTKAGPPPDILSGSPALISNTSNFSLPSPCTPSTSSSMAAAAAAVASSGGGPVSDSTKSTSDNASYHTPIEMSGWVSKFKSRVPTKIRRYFRLTGSFLYNHPSLTEPPTWQISLSHSMVHFHQDRNLILLNLPNRLLRFSLATTSEANRWYVALRSAIVCNIHDFYVLGNIIGDGSYAAVREARCMVTQRMRAVKTIHRSSNAKEREFVQREMTALLNISHHNIVRCYDVFDERHCIHVVMAYQECGDLFNYIQTRPHFGRIHAKYAMWQVMQGIAYLHDRGIAHRDIKLENVLVANEEPLHLQLTDFGFANFVTPQSDNPGREFTSLVGTAHYMAPEVADGTGHGLPVDIFAAGVLMYRLVSGRLPFRALTQRESLKLATEERADFGVREWTGVAGEARALCRWMLRARPCDRPTAQQVLEHGWFSGDAEFLSMAMRADESSRKTAAAGVENERLAWAEWERQWDRRMEIKNGVEGGGALQNVASG